jgi:hypothetical protein
MSKTKKIVFTSVLIFIVYIVTYIGASIFGEYGDKPLILRTWNDKIQRVQHKVQIVWNPSLGKLNYANENVFTRLYYPLILIDREYLHKSMDLATDEGLKKASEVINTQKNREPDR